MPYSAAWNATDPAGSVAAKNIDDHIRKLRLQLQERFEDTLFVSMAADPLVLKEVVSGTTIDLYKTIPFSMFLNDLSAKENKLDDAGRMQGFVGAGPWIAPVQIPTGCVVTEASFLVDRHDAADVVMEFKSRAYGAAPAAATIHATFGTIGAGALIHPSAVLAVTIDAGRYYWLACTGGGAAGNSFYIYAARTKFNRPDMRSAT